MDESWLGELSEFLRIPSVSADPAHANDVRRAAEWVRDFVRRAGGDAEVVEPAEHPLALGRIPASTGEDAPTVLVYGHFDVQPPAPLEEWLSPPFEPALRDGWLYGRGVADDKGQLYLLLKAAADLAAEGALPVNVRIACDGEEEVGGRAILDFVAHDEEPPDACVIFDAHMPARDVPAFYVATRGLCYFHVRVRTGNRDLHSGLYGGAALNATHALVQALAGVLPQEGRLPEALRAGLVPPRREELDDWAKLEPGASVLAARGAIPADRTAAEEFYVRTWVEPALDVNGVAGGSPQLQKTVVPVVSGANLSIRLAAGQQVQEIAAAVERLLREAAPVGADLEIELSSAAPPALVPPETRAVQLGLDAFERALGRRPLLVRSGGTVPVLAALTEKGVPTILTGFDVLEGNIHSPNERLLVDYVPLGIRAARELYAALAAL